MIQLYTFLILSFFFSNMLTVVAQTSIDWQKSFGTSFPDAALKIMNDDDDNMIIFSTEPHEDFTGNLRTYMLAAKLDLEGNQVWSKYHDVAFETHNVGDNYNIGDHFYTEEFGQKLINLVVDVSGHLVLYKLLDASGEFHSYENLLSTNLLVTREDEQIHAATTCSVQLACYGPDSLYVQKINPVPDSNFNTLAWTFELKQDIRTTPIQGHYDFDINDMATDEEGNLYLLVQIERWDFQFCTDCNDEFVDAYSMLYKLNPDGQLVDQERLNITTAVVSHTQFLSVANGNILVRIDDINQLGTAVVTSIYHIDYDLSVNEQFGLDRFYNHLASDQDLNLYGVTNVYDPDDPNIKGESDVIVTRFNNEGQLQWSSYYGGSSFDFPKGFILTSDNGLAFLANTESTDFDIEENYGYQDAWLVKLSEISTATNEGGSIEYSMYPNPAADFIQFDLEDEYLEIHILDLAGKRLVSEVVQKGNSVIQLHGLATGIYFIEIKDDNQNKITTRLIKI